jgi:hypothetical protein
MIYLAGKKLAVTNTVYRFGLAVHFCIATGAKTQSFEIGNIFEEISTVDSEYNDIFSFSAQLPSRSIEAELKG